MQTAYQNYKKQEVEGATKGKIVVLLFEGTIKFLRKASKAIDSGEGIASLIRSFKVSEMLT